MLSLKERPDAVYVASDYGALGALQVLQENNIRVPQDIALVGFSNEPFTKLMNPSITTIEQHSEQIGQLAAKAFLKRMEEKKDFPANQIILEPELIIRDSSNKLKS